jgi:glutathione S-transferase
MVQAFLRSDLGPLREERPTSTFFLGDEAGPLSARASASADKLLRVAERVLPPDASFLARSFSPGDADLALMLQRLIRNGDPCPERLARWANGIFARPSIREWLGKTRWRDR